MWRLRLCLALAALLLGLPARGVQYVNDELLWTKQTWGEYQLDFPWQFFAKREPEVARLLEAEPYLASSLNGPQGDIREEVERDIKRGVDSQPSRFDVSLLDASASAEAAAGVAQCKVCMALASLLWQGLTSWVNIHEAVPAKKRIADYAEQLCELEAPNDVLAEWVVLRAKVQPNQAAPFFLEGNQEFYMLSQRQKQHATPQEIEAVRLACRKLIKDTAPGGAKSELVRITSQLLHKYYDHLEKRLGKARSTGVPVEAVDDGPLFDDSCVNRHPQCDAWAAKGECERNPTYMVGDDRQYIGQCQRACGECVPDEELHPEWSEADADYIAGVSNDLLAVLHSRACAAGPPCASAAGAGSEHLLAMAGGKKGPGGKSLGGFISGPVGGGDQAGEAAVDPQRLEKSRVMLVRQAQESFVPHSPPKAALTRRPAKLTTPAAKALWQELGGKCVYVPAGWWMYEVCLMDDITQFHMTDSHEVDWVISLGKFESASWEVQLTHEAGLFPPGTAVPYVSQSYTHGNDCELTEEEEEEEGQGGSSSGSGSTKQGAGRAGNSGSGAAAGGDATGGKTAGSEAAGSSGSSKAAPKIRRSSELRIMCSPDPEMRVWVEEPQQCQYLVELYVPALCRQEGFQPAGHELAPQASEEE